MKAATGRIKITPENGIPMGGNVRLDNKSRGVHDDLFCNVLILDDGKTTICMMGFDFVGLKYETCNDIKARVHEKTGIKTENMVIWGTHTHSGPDTCMRMYHGIENTINEYLDGVAEKVSAGIGKINKDFKEVKLHIGAKEVHDLSFNRRLVKKDGSVVMNFEEFDPEDITGATGPIDPGLTVLSVRDMNNDVTAVLVNFTLHPAVLVGYGWLISRDFIDGLEKRLFEEYGEDTTVLFANGAEGNINHIDYRNTDRPRDFRETDRIGRTLGGHVIGCIGKSEIIDGDIDFVSSIEHFPFREITEEEREWADMVIERDRDITEDMFDGIPDKTYAKMIKGMLKRPDRQFETVLQGMAIGNFAFVTFPGEVYVEFGLEVKRRSPFKYTMVIGIANSQSGYIPKEEAFSQGGYEVRTAWSSQLTHDAGDLLVQKVDENIFGKMKGKQ